MEITLIIAYGNRDREDDGAGWHILNKLAEALGVQTPQLPGESVQTPDGKLELLYLFQLLPEMGEDLVQVEQVIFIDAHNSDQLPEFDFRQIQADPSRSAFTHHMNPEELLSICQTLNGRHPAAWLLSVRGYSFTFSEKLSTRTAALVAQAAERLISHLRVQERSQ